MTHVARSPLLKPFYLKIFRKPGYLYKFPFQKIVRRVECGHVKIYLLFDLIHDNRTMQRKENFCAHTGFELSISRSQNAIYFYIIPIPHFTIFVIHSFVQNTKKHTWIPFKMLAPCFNGKWMVFRWPFPQQI